MVISPRSPHQPINQRKTRATKPFSMLGDRNRKELIRDFKGVAKTFLENKRRDSSIGEMETLLKSTLETFSSTNKPKSKQSDENAMQHASGPIIQGLVQSFCKAPPRSFQRLRILSIMSLDVTLDQLNNIYFKDTSIVITRDQQRAANKHAREYGRSGEPLEHEKRRQQRRLLDTETARRDVGFSIQFISQYLQSLAFGTKTTILSNGQVLETPKITLTKPANLIKQDLYEAIEKCRNSSNNSEEVRDDGYEPPPNHLPKAHVDEIIESLSGGSPVNLAALDSTYVKCLLDTFKSLDFLIDIITTGEASKRTALKAQAASCKIFLDKQYPDHLHVDSKCASHSYSAAFGADDVEKEYNQYCLECQSLTALKIDVSAAIRAAAPNLKEGEETVEELLEYFEAHIVGNLVVYIGHVVRKAWQSRAEEKIYETMNRETDCIIRVDFKMKCLSMAFRESMVDFFGKRGITWGGIAITAFKSEAERAVEEKEASSAKTSYKSLVKTSFFDVVSNDSTEDAYSICSYLQAAVQTYVKVNPHICRCYVLTDGAGCFVCVEFLGFLANLGYNTGLFVRLHLVSESGCGKSYLDGHFCYGMLHLSKVVKFGEGKNDIHCAEDIASALTMLGGIKNSMPILCTSLNRSTAGRENSKARDAAAVDDDVAQDDEEEEEEATPADEPSKAAPSLHSKIKELPGLKSFLHREIVYSEDGEVEAIHLSSVSFLFDEPDMIISRAELADHFPERKLPPSSLITYEVGSLSVSLSSRDLNQCITKEEKALKADLHSSRKIKAQEKFVAAEQAEARLVKNNLSLSTLLYCSTAKCFFSCERPCTLAQHESRGEHWFTKTAVRHRVRRLRHILTNDATSNQTFIEKTVSYRCRNEASEGTTRDTIKMMCADSTKGVLSAATLSSSQQTERPDHVMTLAAIRQECPQFNPSSSSTSFFRLGFGFKRNCASVPTSVGAMKFVVYLQGRGDKAGDNVSKTIPSSGAKAMKLLGTKEGEKIFNDTDNDRATMKANETETRVFKLHELLSATQLKSFLSKPRQALLLQLKNLFAKMAKKKEEAENPLLAAINALKTRGKLIALYTKVVSNHDGAVHDRVVHNSFIHQSSPYAYKPAQLRTILYNLVHTTYGRTEKDVKLFLR